jgi:hypothetical protein
MKATNISVFYFVIFVLSMANAQQFQQTSIPDVTDTPSASRSANFIDVNGDGWDDLFITNGPFSGQNNMLYINNGNGSFTTITGDPIVNDNDRSDGASFADADNDGDLDAFVVTYGANGSGKKNYFYRNNGDGSFTYEPGIAMGLPLTYSEMANWIDVNNDQNLDLYFTNSFQSLSNRYFENLGDGSFEAVANLSITSENLPSRSIDWVDYDGDGDSDLFITNEENEKNSLFRNDGANNFTQITNLAIVQDLRNSAGSSWADIDNDGDFDLFVGNWGNSGQANQLFINTGGSFTEDTNSVIAAAVTSSFGSTFGDVDNDGDLDLFVCNSYLNGQNTNFLYMNDGNGNFTLDVSSDLANFQGWSFGAAFGDYDNDGWLDILLANTQNENQANALFRNTGTGNNWVKLTLIGTVSNYSAVGAKIRLRSTFNGNEVWQTRHISAASGYCSQNSYKVHFGLGNATIIDEIEVSWPSGLVETFANTNVNGNYTAIEGDGTLGNVENERQNVVIFPNPVEDTITVSGQLLQEYKSVVFRVFTLDGRVVEEQFMKNQTKNKVDLSKLASGIYLYSLVHQSANLQTGKLVKY